MSRISSSANATEWVPIIQLGGPKQYEPCSKPGVLLKETHNYLISRYISMQKEAGSKFDNKC